MARRPISNVRGRNTFRRRQGRTQPRSITLIVCEGETEEAYLEAARIHYNLTSAEVVVAENTKGAAPISVVECAEERAREKGGYDHIYCAFDRDDHESFGRARTKIRDLAARAKNRMPIKEAVSIPCFEFWILIHFERTDAPFENCGAVIARIRARHMPNYEKADDRVSKELMARIDTAIANGTWLAGRAADIGNNPLTSMHELVRHMATVARQPVP